MTMGSKLQERQPLSSGIDETRLRRAAIVGQLAGGIVHDFNNVLTVIAGTIDILAEAVADQPQLAAIARLIEEAASRGAVLTAHLRAFARGHGSQPREVELNALLADAVRLLRPTLGGIEVSLAAVPDIPPVLADPGDLMAAVLSLAIAAREGMPEGGRLDFGVEARVSERAGAARACGEEAVVITIDAHGYAEVSGHHERNLGGFDVAREFIGRCSGQLEVGPVLNDRVRLEILLAPTGHG